MKLKQLAVSLAATAAISTSVSANQLTSQEALENYVNENAKKFTKEHLEKFGLRYEGEPSMPKFQYLSLEKNHVGECDFENDTVTFDHIRLLEIPPAGEKISRSRKKKIARTVENTLHHELAHYNNGLLRDELNLAYLGTLDQEVVEEGIATYVANSMTKNGRACGGFAGLTSELYRKDNNELVYAVGECVVGPIVGMYKERGIKYMLRNSMTEEELKNPFTYRMRILNDLAAGKDLLEEPKPEDTFLPSLLKFHFGT